MSSVTHLDKVGFPALLSALIESFPSAIPINYYATCGIISEKLPTADEIAAIRRLGVALSMLVELKLAQGHYYESEDARYYWDYRLIAAGYAALAKSPALAEAALPGLLAELALAVTTSD